jgi:hypothetical protein
MLTTCGGHELSGPRNHTLNEAIEPPGIAWRWRVGAWLATLAAIALFAWIVAQWAWRAFGPAVTSVPPAATPEPWSAAITSARIFGERGAAPAAGGTPSAMQGDTRLLGVFAEANGGGFALFRLADRGPVLVQAGHEIAKDVLLEVVRPGGVRIRDHGEVREIVLRPTPEAAKSSVDRPPTGARSARAGASASCAAPAGFTGAVFRLNAELLSGIAAQPDSWKTLVTAGPGGLTVRDESGFAAMLGLKPGDRVTEANGIALNGPDDALVAIVRPLMASQPVRVRGTRDGKTSEWLLVNAGACPG